MVGFPKRQWFLLAGVGALIPITALCWGFRKTCWVRGALQRLPSVLGAYNSKDDDTDSSEAAKMSDSERKRYHAALQLLKERANTYFQKGNYEKALETYQGCLDACVALGSSDQEAVQVHHVIRANLVLLFLRLEQPETARMVATFLLQDETHPLADNLKVKVLYRRGLASRVLKDRESALCDFRAAIACSPGKKNVEAESAIIALSEN